MTAPAPAHGAFTGPAQDRLAIRELVDAYADAVCRRDADAWIRTWAPQGRWLIRGVSIVGHDALRSTWLGAMAAYRSVSFSAYPGAIHAEGDTARLRVQTTEWLVPLDGRPRLQHGTYEDELVRVDGCWLFAQRSFTVQQAHEF
jgi:ketosteroid isomerase-like protein